MIWAWVSELQYVSKIFDLKKSALNALNLVHVGKTFQALGIADFYRDDWPLLIVTTATARTAWERHIRDLLPSVPAKDILCLQTAADYFGDCKVLITSYQMMEKSSDKLLQKQFGFIILVSKLNECRL